MRALDRIRQAIREQKYRISTHANEEMSEDDLLAADIENAILTGEIARRVTRDPRGARFEVVGEALDGENVYVLCRFLPSGTLLIITAYGDQD